MSKKFQISVDCTVYLTVDEIWPDGDAPENPTVDDVAEAIRVDCGGVVGLLSDWQLADDTTVSVQSGGDVADVEWP